MQPDIALCHGNFSYWMHCVAKEMTYRPQTLALRQKPHWPPAMVSAEFSQRYTGNESGCLPSLAELKPVHYHWLAMPKRVAYSSMRLLRPSGHPRASLFAASACSVTVVGNTLQTSGSRYAMTGRTCTSKNLVHSVMLAGCCPRARWNRERKSRASGC